MEKLRYQYSYKILREKYQALQIKYKNVLNESDKKDRTIENLEYRIKCLEKDLREKELIIGWLSDRQRLD